MWCTAARSSGSSSSSMRTRNRKPANVSEKAVPKYFIDGLLNRVPKNPRTTKPLGIFRRIEEMTREQYSSIVTESTTTSRRKRPAATGARGFSAPCSYLETFPADDRGEASEQTETPRDCYARPHVVRDRRRTSHRDADVYVRRAGRRNISERVQKVEHQDELVESRAAYGRSCERGQKECAGGPAQPDDNAASAARLPRRQALEQAVPHKSDAECHHKNRKPRRVRVDEFQEAEARKDDEGQGKGQHVGEYDRCEVEPNVGQRQPLARDGFRPNHFNAVVFPIQARTDRGREDDRAETDDGQEHAQWYADGGVGVDDCTRPMRWN